MDDQMLDLTDPGDRIVGRLLEAYGEEKLSPSIAATTRMRMGVMAAGHRRAALIEADATFDAAGETTAALAAKRAQAARTAWRRPVAAILAGTLTLGFLSGTAFMTRPGGPLYEARLWTEMANLPAGVVDRAQAEVHRLEQRITEAESASTARDAIGTEAALVAYSRIVVEATAGTRQNPAARATIKVTVTRHVDVLTHMLASVPEPARDAAQQALVSTTTALDRLDGPAGADPAAAPAKSTKDDKSDKDRPAKDGKDDKHRTDDKTPKPEEPPAEPDRAP